MFRKLWTKPTPVPAPAAREPMEHARMLTQEGHFEQAVALLRPLLEHQAVHAEAWYRLGNALRGLARNDEALAAFQRALDIDPNYTAALCNRGVLLLTGARATEALAHFDRAVAVDPKDAIAHYNRALARLALGQSETALASLQVALQANPDYFEALFTRARLHEDAQRWSDALPDFERAHALRPDYSATPLHLANCLARLRRWQEALPLYDVSLTQDPGNGTAHLQRGNVLRELQRWDEALSSYDRSIAINAGQIDGHFNRGLLLEQLNRVPEALLGFERAVQIDPLHAAAQHSRSLALLLLGRLAEGFTNYEWRWRNRATLDPAQYRGTLPLWTPSNDTLRDQRILVFSEQGLGDTIQFCRFVPQLAERGACVVFEVQPALRALLQNLEGAAQVLSSADALPALDLKIPLMSLPLALGTSLESLPAPQRYLHSDPKIVRQWLDKLGPKRRARIGLVWSGNPLQPEDRHRSMPLATLVKHLPREFDYFCLQRDLRAVDEAVLAKSPFINHPDADFVQTAALCDCMDLVISVCTSIAHLAGALGRPVWVLLSNNADWRWFLDRDDSPWYPSARLYRQQVIGDWDGVAGRVAQDLRTKYG